MSVLIAARSHRSAAVGLVLALAIFSCQDAVIKSLSGAYPVHQALVMRSLAAVPILWWLVRRAPDGGPIGARWPLVARGAVLLVAYGGYYLALPAMPLASAVALWFVAPLFVAALSAPIAGEQVPRAVWGAVLIGFAGVVVMLRPGGGLATWAALLPVASALAYAGAQLMARRLRGGASAQLMSFHQNTVYGVGALLLAGALAPLADAAHDDPTLDFLLRSWSVPSLRDALLMLACGPIAAVGTVLLSHAYRVAGGSVAPFEYTSLLWATLWGVAVWGEVPDLGAIAGAALIVGSGIYAVARTG